MSHTTRLDLPVIRHALAERLKGLSPDVMVYEEWPGTPQMFPCLVFYPPERVQYRVTGRMDQATWELLGLVGRPSPTSHRIMEALMSGAGELSIIKCLYEDKKLGGLIAGMRVTGVNSGMYVVTATPNNDVLGFDLTIEVNA